MNMNSGITRLGYWLMALSIAAFSAGCGNQGSDPILGGGGAGLAPIVVEDTIAPRIISTTPTNGETGWPINRVVTVTFSEAMDPETLVSESPSHEPDATFTLCVTDMDGGECISSVDGVVSYVDNTATFSQDANLAINTWYRADVSTAATDLAGNALLVPPVFGGVANPWYLQTGDVLDETPPIITVTSPEHEETDVAINKTINATFSEAMRQSTLNSDSFTVMETVSENPLLGTVSYDVMFNIASFVPAVNLLADTEYTVTISNEAEDLAGNALLVPAVPEAGEANNPWTFRTAATFEEPVALAIDLRSAESFGIASHGGLTSTGVTVVNGDVALYPTATCTDSTGNAGASQSCLVKTYASPTGLTVNGSIYWAGDPFDDGATALSVTNDLNAAWVEGKNKENTFATGFLVGELGAPGPDGKVLLPGVYHEPSLDLSAGNVVTFDANNDPNAIFIVKIDSSFVDYGVIGNETQVVLANGAQARNIWFIAGLDITIGSGTIWNGNILAGRTATINHNSALLGRVLAGASGAGAFTLTGAATPSVTSITVP